MNKRLIALLTVSALLLATGCSKDEPSAASSSEVVSESTSSTTSTESTTTAAESAEPASDASEPAQTAEESTPADEKQPTEEAAQTEDNPLLAMDAQELYEKANELAGDIEIEDSLFNRNPLKKYEAVLEDSNRKLSYVYESFPQEDGSVAVVRSTTYAGLLECAESYYVSSTADGITAERGTRCYMGRVGDMPAGYTEPVIDYNDPTSLIDPEGLTAGDIYLAIDRVIDAFLYMNFGECEGGNSYGECFYNGTSSYEWLEKLFKKYFTEDTYNANYDAETNMLIGRWINDNGTCVKKEMGFGGPIPDVLKCEFVTNNDSEIVVRAYLGGYDFGDEEWPVLSTLTKTENGWKIVSCNVREEG